VTREEESQVNLAEQPNAGSKRKRHRIRVTNRAWFGTGRPTPGHRVEVAPFPGWEDGAGRFSAVLSDRGKRAEELDRSVLPLRLPSIASDPLARAMR